MNDDLQHYGVKGMKWGVRRYQPYTGTKKFVDTTKQKLSRKTRIQKKERKLSDRRSKIREKDGVATKKYIKTSKKLNLERRKLDRVNSKSKKSEDRVTARHNLKDARRLVKEGSGSAALLNSQEMKKVFGYDLTPKQEQAIRSSEWASSAGKMKMNRALKPAMAVAATAMTPVALNKGAEFVAKNGIVPTELVNKAVDLYNNLAHSHIDDDELQHYGVKGMKWGVRRYQPYPKGQRNAGKFIDVTRQKGGSNQNGNKSNKVTKDSGLKDSVKATVRSKGREFSMARAQREIKNLTTKDAKKVVTRSQLENRMKRLSNTRNVGDEQAKRDYLNRGSMTNQELKRKVDRLQLSDNMRQEARKANSGVMDVGKKVAAIAAPLAVQYAVHNNIDKEWLMGKVNPVNVKDWDKIGKQAAQAIDKLL